MKRPSGGCIHMKVEFGGILAQRGVHLREFWT